MRLIATVQFALFSMLALGCASSHVLVGKARPPISVDQVKLYLHPPAKYEEIAVLQASSERSFAITDQGKMNKVIDRLKEEAAKLGANGILLQGTGTENTSSVLTPADGSTLVIPESYKTGSGIAILVIQE